MLTKNAIAVLVLILGYVTASVGFAQAPVASVTYSAIAVHQLPGKPETFGTIVKSGQNLRLEFEENGRHVVQILLPAAGVMFILDPATRTYVEITGASIPATNVEGYVSPCPNQQATVDCRRLGDDMVSGLKVERWALASGQPDKPLVILWNSARRKALHQQFPGGGEMAMSFVAMEEIGGRNAEHWAIKLTTPGQAVRTGDWWFDPELRVVIRESLPSGENRRLDNITLGPVDPILFQIPQGWRKTELAANALQNPVAGNP